MVTSAANDLAFDRIAIGDTFEIERTFASEDVAAFARLSGDYSPLHMDPVYAATTEFGGCVEVLGEAILQARLGQISKRR